MLKDLSEQNDELKEAYKAIENNDEWELFLNYKGYLTKNMNEKLFFAISVLNLDRNEQKKVFHWIRKIEAIE